MAWNDYTEIRCQLEFSCPKSWDEMGATDDASVRFCDHCQSRVYEALVPADLLRHRALGRCVSVRIARPDDEVAGAPAVGDGGDASAPGEPTSAQLPVLMGRMVPADGDATPPSYDPRAVALEPRLTGKVSPLANTPLVVSVTLFLVVPPVLIWLGVLAL